MDSDTQQHSHSGHLFTTAATTLAAGLIFSPYLLPLIGIGTQNDTVNIAISCSTFSGSGLAGALNGVLGSVPLIGESLAAGGWTTALIAAGIGFGSRWIGNYLSKYVDKPNGFPWGKFIREAGLYSSILISLPSIISGISMGIAFLGSVLFGQNITEPVMQGLGTIAGMGSVATQVSTLIPHLFSCGAAALPVIGPLLFGEENHREHAETQPKPLSTILPTPQSHGHWVTRIAAPLADATPPLPTRG